MNNISGTPLAAGDTFKLFDAASCSGAFANVTLPSPPAGLGWNTNSLNTNGMISVVIATAPVISPALLSVTNLVFSGTAGVVKANFSLLAFSNLSLPLTNWTPLLTNYFDNQGNFNFTNAIPRDAPQNFYLLQLP